MAAKGYRQAVVERVAARAEPNSPVLVAGIGNGAAGSAAGVTLTPPDSAFGPVWTVLYIMMGISSVQAFKAGEMPKRQVPERRPSEKIV